MVRRNHWQRARDEPVVGRQSLQRAEEKRMLFGNAYSLIFVLGFLNAFLTGEAQAEKSLLNVTPSKLKCLLSKR